MDLLRGGAGGEEVAVRQKGRLSDAWYLGQPDSCRCLPLGTSLARFWFLELGDESAFRGPLTPWPGLPRPSFEVPGPVAKGASGLFHAH